MGTAQFHLYTAGHFATARRGGLTNEEIRQIEAHRARERPTPWQALAKRYAVSEITLRQLFDGLESISPSPMADPNDQKLKDMWRRGVRSNVICSELGISRSTLWAKRTHLGLPSRQEAKAA
jgi:hypothetical protein